MIIRNSLRALPPNFAPEILKGYLQQIEKWVAKTTWLSRPCLSYTLVFWMSVFDLNKCGLTSSRTLTLLLPTSCFPSCAFPKMMSRNSSLTRRNIFTTNSTIMKEVSAPDVAATNFLVTLTKARRKQTFTILAFVNKIVSEYESTEDDKKNHIARKELCE